MPRRLLCIVGLAASGCGAGEERIEVHPVSGSVVVGGAPAVGVKVVFHPEIEAASQFVFPRTKSDQHGKFVLSTYEPGDGVPAGQYVVTASWKSSDSSNSDEVHPDELSSGDEKLDVLFTDPDRSPLHALVEEGDNQLAPFELKLASKRRRKKRK